MRLIRGWRASKHIKWVSSGVKMPNGETGQQQPTKQRRKAARLLAQGASFTDALTAAGYSPAQARKGMAKVQKSRGLQEALLEEMKKFPPEVRRDLVRLRLVHN